MRALPQQNLVNQPHAGVIVGTSTAFVGFFCEQPCTNPKTVSSIAASNAPPQFGSLQAACDQHQGSPCSFQPPECISRGSTTAVVEERADVVGKAVLGTLWHYISFGKIRLRVQSTVRGLLHVPEGRSCAASTTSSPMSESQRAVQTRGECLYRPLHA